MRHRYKENDLQENAGESKKKTVPKYKKLNQSEISALFLISSEMGPFERKIISFEVTITETFNRTNIKNFHKFLMVERKLR